ncbi:hypothetical protein QAD02_003712 [Eretmocerus hayati]|uniref:Uncharacterized protein n=1 Tax=Eretmocerus hayati TaxID=131215 RepID=A0ACC2NNQ3_9HYME|nr:hypothetical protein QAD02_003712 [Eretmocerus hayati]
MESYDSLFVDTWPSIAQKIVKHLSSSRSLEISRFYVEKAELFNSGTNDSLLALFLISLSPNVPKKVKVNGLPENVAKAALSKCFILHVEDPAKRSEEQKTHESWLLERHQEVLPYIIFCGKLPNIEAYLHVNSQLHTFENPLEAVQACYKCLTALQRFPNLAEFAWSYIDLAVYGFSFKSINANVKQFSAKVSNVQIVETEVQIVDTEASA